MKSDAETTPTIPPDQLRLIGLALCGEHWQAELGHAWNIADRSIRRWASGERPFPAERIPDLRALAEARRGAIAEAEQLLAALDYPSANIGP